MSVQVSDSLQMGSVDTPLDARTRIATLGDVANISLPYVGMVFFCIETGKHYKVKSLKSKTIGAASQDNAQVNEYEALPDKTDLAQSGSGTSVKRIVLARSGGSGAYHLKVEASEAADYSGAVTLVDTLNAEADRAKVKILSEMIVDEAVVQGWSDFPAEGAGSNYECAPVVVDCSALDTSKVYFLRYKWYNDELDGFWMCTVFPAFGLGSVSITYSVSDRGTTDPVVDPDNPVDPGEPFDPDEDLKPPNDARLWYVTPTGSGTKDGSSWDNAMANLSAAINAASSGDAVYVMGGSYTFISSIVSRDGIPVYGGFNPADTSWDARDPVAYPSIFDANGLACGIISPDGIGSVVDGVTILNSQDMETTVACKMLRNCKISGCSAIRKMIAANVNMSTIINCSCTFTMGNAYLISGNVTNSTLINCITSSSEIVHIGTFYSASILGNVSNSTLINCTNNGYFLCRSSVLSSEIVFHSYLIRGNASNSTLINCTSVGNYKAERYDTIINGGILFFCRMISEISINSTLIRCSNGTAGGRKNTVYWKCSGSQSAGTSCASTNSGQAILLSDDNVQTRFVDIGTVKAIGAIEIADPDTYDWSAFGDFRLADSYSALFGAGTYDADVLTDADGKTRPNPPSIGAYEPIA